MRIFVGAAGLLAIATQGAWAISEADARNLTSVAYLWAYPIMLTYKAMYEDVIAKGEPYPFDKFVYNEKLPNSQSSGPNPNVDFITATMWADMRDGAKVVTMPAQDIPQRYISLQSTYMKGYETDYVGTRMQEDKLAGSYYIQAPNTKLKTDPGGLFKTILYSDSQFTRVQARVSVLGPQDVKNAKKVLEAIKVQTLPEFLEPSIGYTIDKKAPSPYPAWYTWNDALLIPKDPEQQEANANDAMPALPTAQAAAGSGVAAAVQGGDEANKGNRRLDDGENDSLAFINFVNWALPYMKIHKGNESKFIDDATQIGIKKGEYTDFSTFPPETVNAMKMGVKDAYATIYNKDNQAKYAGTDKLTDLNWDVKDFQRHAVCSVIGENGVFTVTPWETEVFAKDFPDAQPGDKYTLKFDASKIPGVNAAGAGFWSVTAYTLPDRKLVPNPLGRFSIQSNSPTLKFDPDGGLEILLQADAPDNGKQGNWLPIPQDGPFSYVLRIYGPGGNAMPMTKSNEPLQPDAISPVAIRAANDADSDTAVQQQGNGGGRRGLRTVTPTAN